MNFLSISIVKAVGTLFDRAIESFNNYDMEGTNLKVTF